MRKTIWETNEGFLKTKLYKNNMLETGFFPWFNAITIYQEIY